MSNPPREAPADPPERSGGGPASPRRKLAVLAVAAGLAALAYAFPLPGIPEEGRRLTAVLAVVVTLWVSEIIPLAATALLGPSFAVVAGVAPAGKAFAAFGSPIILLFIGSFLLGHATFKHRLNERIAYRVLSLGILKSDPALAFIFLGLTTAALSAWMSNTATTAMMLPIAQSLLLAMIPQGGGKPPPLYSTGLMLIVAYSASLGGLFTPIGTPPNLIGLGLLEQGTGTRVSFVEWMAKVLPVALVSLLAMMGYFAFLFRGEKHRLVYDRARMVRRYEGLGPWPAAQRHVAGALLCVAGLWIFPPLLALLWPEAGKFLDARLPEAVSPLLVAGALFFLPAAGPDGEGKSSVLDLKDLNRIDWPTIVLFAGGMCLGDLMNQSGLARALGENLVSFAPASSPLLLTGSFVLLAILVSEATSNTASANMVVPVVLAVAKSLGVDPVGPALAATAACTFGFMLPVSTPTNAMAYATGRVSIGQMIRFGVVLDLIGAALLTLWFGWALA